MTPDQQLGRLDNLLYHLREARRDLNEIADAATDPNLIDDMNRASGWLSNLTQMTEEVRQVALAEMETA